MKLCKNCKYFKPFAYPACSHPKATSTMYDLVGGNHIRNYIKCWDMRYSDYQNWFGRLLAKVYRRCGPDALLYEEK